MSKRVVDTHTLRTHTHFGLEKSSGTAGAPLSDLTQVADSKKEQQSGGKFSGNGTEVNKMKGGNGNRF